MKQFFILTEESIKYLNWVDPEQLQVKIIRIPLIDGFEYPVYKHEISLLKQVISKIQQDPKLKQIFTQLNEQFGKRLFELFKTAWKEHEITLDLYITGLFRLQTAGALDQEKQNKQIGMFLSYGGEITELVHNKFNDIIRVFLVQTFAMAKLIQSNDYNSNIFRFHYALMIGILSGLIVWIRQYKKRMLTYRQKIDNFLLSALG